LLSASQFGFKSLDVMQRHAVADPFVSILVRVKNEKHAINAFLESLRRQDAFERTEIIFLDSGSTDGTLSELAQFPCSVYTIAPDEFSFGPTCNLICSLANAPVLSLMSGHIELVEQDAVMAGVAFLQPSSRFAAGYYRQIPNETIGASAYERAFLRRKFFSGSGPERKHSKRHAFSNAASIFTATAWRAIPFPSVGASEDYLWAEELLAKDGELFYLPHFSVRHSHNEQPHQVRHRVKINVDARPDVERSWRNVSKYFLGVAGACLLQRASPMEAIRFGAAHASAYIPGRLEK